MEKNHKRLAAKVVLAPGDNTDPQTSITKGSFIPTTNRKIVAISQKTSNPPSTRRRGGGEQEPKANIKELTNLGTLQVNNFELYVENIKQLLLCQIQYFKAGSISTCYSRWLDLT